MPHVDLSLSESPLPPAGHQHGSSLHRWAVAVHSAEENCLVLDDKAVIVAVSEPFERMLGLDQSVAGRDLLPDVLRLVDFADAGPVADGEVSKIPPLFALTTGRLVRGLLKVRAVDNAVLTLDAVATPLTEETATVGSLTFFSRI